MFLHCMIHKNALVVGILSNKFNNILNMVVSIIYKLKYQHYIQDNLKHLATTSGRTLLNWYIIQKSCGYHMAK